MKRGRERVTLHPANVSSLLGSSSEIGLPEAPAKASASDDRLAQACASVLLEISSSHHIDPYNASQLNKEAQAH
jgi:hypothetical protein